MFPGEKGPNPFSNAQNTSDRLKKMAGVVDDLRIHDLRHSFASIAVNAGATLNQDRAEQAG